MPDPIFFFLRDWQGTAREPLQPPVITVCALRWTVGSASSLNHFIFGMAVCNPLDGTPNKKIGKTIAWGRALARWHGKDGTMRGIFTRESAWTELCTVLRAGHASLGYDIVFNLYADESSVFDCLKPRTKKASSSVETPMGTSTPAEVPVPKSSPALAEPGTLPDSPLARP